MANRFNIPKDPELAKSVLQAQQAEMGWLGKFFGSKDNATLYVACILIVFSLMVVLVLAYNEPTLRADTLKGVFGLVALVAGYMFGHGAKSHQ